MIDKEENLDFHDSNHSDTLWTVKNKIIQSSNTIS
jgi:hypothetical protein